MYSIKYSSKAYNNIDLFINSYKSVFKNLYIDTWIDNEDLIIKNYIEVWNILYKNIKVKISNILLKETILWRNIAKKEVYHIVISVNSFRLFVYYTENISKKIRYIELIEFFRK